MEKENTTVIEHVYTVNVDPWAIIFAGVVACWVIRAFRS